MREIKRYFADEVGTKLREQSTKKKKIKGIVQVKSILDIAIEEKLKHIAQKKDYGPKFIKDRLIKIFKNKCGYCEGRAGRGHLHIDHFRDKYWYYWLTYEWTNMVLACHKCNSDFKKAQFPLKGDGKISSPPLKNGELDFSQFHILSDILENEGRLLLHPAIDNPKEHLTFLPSGNIGGTSEKGKESVKVYGLNSNDLQKLRGNIIVKIVNIILSDYITFIVNNGTDIVPSQIQSIIKRQYDYQKRIIAEDDREYSSGEPFKEFIAFREAILCKFTEFVIDNPLLDDIPEEDRSIMRLASNTILQQSKTS